MTAYVVLFINKKTLRLDGWSIYSEPSPTCSSLYLPLVLFEITDRFYETAREKVVDILRNNPAYAWLKKSPCHCQETTKAIGV